MNHENMAVGEDRQLGYTWVLVHEPYLTQVQLYAILGTEVERVKVGGRYIPGRIHALYRAREQETGFDKTRVLSDAQPTLYGIINCDGRSEWTVADMSRTLMFHNGSGPGRMAEAMNRCYEAVRARHAGMPELA